MFLDQDNQNMPQPANDDLIFDVGTQDFEEKVMKASMEAPILVDFWAPWCGPCKQLGPMLEKIVKETGGHIKLAKVNIDEHQELAQAMRVQSVPMVFAFFQGQPVNGFSGAKSESEIKAFIAEILKIAQQAQPDAIDIPQALTEAAQAMADGALNIAQGIYVQILSQDEHNVDAYTGLIRMFIAANQKEHAQEMINEATDEMLKDPKFEAAKTALELAQNAPSGDEVSAMAGRVEKKPDDHQARFDFAMALFSSGRGEEAIDALIEIIRRNRAWEEEKARQQLLKFFEALGPADPVTIEGRKKLSSVLFS